MATKCQRGWVLWVSHWCECFAVVASWSSSTLAERKVFGEIFPVDLAGLCCVLTVLQLLLMRELLWMIQLPTWRLRWLSCAVLLFRIACLFVLSDLTLLLLVNDSQTGRNTVKYLAGTVTVMLCDLLLYTGAFEHGNSNALRRMRTVILPGLVSQHATLLELN